MSLRHMIATPWREWWDERSALMEYEGGLSRATAEEAARQCVVTYMQDHTPLDYSREGFVYILHAEGTPSYKIGRSMMPLARKESLQTGTPHPLCMLRKIYCRDAVTFEKTLHTRYASFRRKGEWFDLPRKVLLELLQEELP